MKTIHTWMSKGMPECHVARDCAWQQVHGKPVALRKRASLELHLLVCPSCRSHRNRLKWLREGVANLSSIKKG